MCFLGPARLHSLIDGAQSAPTLLDCTGQMQITGNFSHYLLTRLVSATGEKSQMKMNDKSEFSAIPLIISFKHGHSLSVMYHFSSMQDFVIAHYIKHLLKRRIKILPLEYIWIRMLKNGHGGL